jgi:protein-S-isoprenylcysteine O-methyltransferase Ste14
MVASALPLALVLAAVVALAATGNLLSASPLVIAAQVAAVMLNLWARSSFEKGTFRVEAAPGGTSLIRRGPYRVLRHPMYSAALMFVWASVLGHISAFTVGLGVAVTALTMVRVGAEERLLQAQYPDYGEYMRTTKALVPFLY